MTYLRSILWSSNYYVNMSLGLKKVAEKLKMILFGLKSGQDLQNRAAHPQQEHPPGIDIPSSRRLSHTGKLRDKTLSDLVSHSRSRARVRGGHNFTFSLAARGSEERRTTACDLLRAMKCNSFFRLCFSITFPNGKKKIKKIVKGRSRLQRSRMSTRGKDQITRSAGLPNTIS